MRLLPLPDGSLRLRLDLSEARLLDQLITQLMGLLQGHSGTALDPDPLFASLEVGGSDSPPLDPALARLLPNAYEDEADASQFRRVTEQGLINRKLQDALTVTCELGIESVDRSTAQHVEATIGPEVLPAWVKTLTALRLAIAARIGLVEEADHARLAADDETKSTVAVYDWLAAILDAVLRVRA